jgi:hypothetical protein
MVALGFLIFTLLDGVAGAAQLSGLMGFVSMWWFELAFSVFAVVSLPLLRWLFLSYGRAPEAADTPGNNPATIALS